MKHRVEFVGLVGAALALALLAYGGRAAQNAPISTASSYDTGTNGYRALYETLRAAGVDVTRFEAPTGRLDRRRIGVLVVAASEGDGRALSLDKRGRSALHAFVAAGGRLVVLAPSFDPRTDAVPGAGATTALPAERATLLRANAVAARGSDRDLRGVAWVEAPIGAAFGRTHRHAVGLLANGHGIVALRYRIGKGDAIAIAAPQLWSNALVGRADNLRFAYNVLAKHGTVAFDEYVHGYVQATSFWGALPATVHLAVWIGLALGVLGLIGANLPFAPTLALDPPDERDTSAYLDAMAALMRRARAARTAIAAFARDAEAHAPRDPETQQRQARIATLAREARPSDAALLEAARLDYRLRKET